MRQTLFLSARLKLTAWYLIILILVSGLFSLVIYQGVSAGLEQGFARAHQRLANLDEGQLVSRNRHMATQLLVEDLEAAQNSLKIRLVIANGIILLLSAIAAYLLAGKSLQPIEEALDQQKRFVADASHELKTPIAALKTSMEVEKRDKKTSQATKKLISEYLDDVADLEALGESLLDFTAFEAGIKTTIVDQQSILAEVKRAAKTIHPLAKKRKVSLKLQLTDQSFRMFANPGSIEKLATILLDNAVKYSQQEGRVELKLEKQRYRLLLRVTDNGVGIDSADIPHIFERFYRVDSSRTRSGAKKGVGLGLSLAQQIVAAHRGSIVVESKVGQGSTFVATFPLA